MPPAVSPGASSMRQTLTLSSSYTSSVPIGFPFGSASSTLAPPRAKVAQMVSWPLGVGAALSPRETKKLVLGRGSYVGDLTVPGMLHAAFVRSPHAHARIGRIDADAARRQPGIAAVLTGYDLARVTAPLRIAPRSRASCPWRCRLCRWTRSASSAIPSP